MLRGLACGLRCRSSMNLALPLAGLVLLIADAAPGGCHSTPHPDPGAGGSEPAEEQCVDPAPGCIVPGDGSCKAELASCARGVWACPVGATMTTPEDAEATCMFVDAG